MNREDIIRMARAAYGDWYPNTVPHDLERFAALVAAAEREACAKVCEEYADDSGDDHEAGGAYGCRDAIRSRGEVKP